MFISFVQRAVKRISKWSTWASLLVCNSWAFGRCPFHTQLWYYHHLPMNLFTLVMFKSSVFQHSNTLPVFCCCYPNLFETCCWHPITQDLQRKLKIKIYGTDGGTDLESQSKTTVEWASREDWRSEGRLTWGKHTRLYHNKRKLMIYQVTQL